MGEIKIAVFCNYCKWYDRYQNRCEAPENMKYISNYRGPHIFAGFKTEAYKQNANNDCTWYQERKRLKLTRKQWRKILRKTH